MKNPFKNIYLNKQNKIIGVSALTTVVILLFVTIYVFSGNETCDQIRIEFKGNKDNVYIEGDDVKALILEVQPDIIGSKLNNISIKKIEDCLNNSSILEHAEVYTSIDNSLVIEVVQSTPIVRVINSKNISYAIDRDANLISVSKRYPVHTLIANGKINVSNKKLKTNILTDTVLNKTILSDIYEVALEIYNDPFLKMQTEQIYVNDNNEIELVPRVGNHIILVGKKQNCKERLQNLKYFYLSLDKHQWNDYELVNVKYSNQVVCTRKS